jgi:NADH:ubiquinone reductase (H+-translocating)
MKLNVPASQLPRIVIIGAGFAGLKLARKINSDKFQVVLIDKYNYHQFQPLFYQVATSGLEASSISFPLRQIFHKHKNIHVRLATLLSVNASENIIFTSNGKLHYDQLVICTGLDNNYYGLENVKKYAFPIKSVTEAVQTRNAILENFENALTCENADEQQEMMNIAIIGGGPTGVELAGSLAEMKKQIFPLDYPELDFRKAKIYLVEGYNTILSTFSAKSSEVAKKYLKNLGVDLLLNTVVKDFDGRNLFFNDGTSCRVGTLIWAAGVKGLSIEGLDQSIYGAGGRIKVDRLTRIKGYENIYAVGDIALMETEKYPKGHPQIAQVALQQAKFLARLFNNKHIDNTSDRFEYKDSGTMATIGRNKAVAELPLFRFKGFMAWLVWCFIHLMAIVGVKNRVQIFINWAWSYTSYNKAYRMIYKFKDREQP